MASTAGMYGRALPPLPGEKPTIQSVDFFLPTGIMVNMKVNTSSTLAQLKEDLFKEAKAYPLFKLLKDQSFYNFLGKQRGWPARLPYLVLHHADLACNLACKTLPQMKFGHSGLAHTSTPS